MICPDPPQNLRTLNDYDLILVNTSGGKDSALTLWYVVQIAGAHGIHNKVQAVHATFPEEWPGTVDLVRRQCEALDVPVEVVSRGEGLLDYVRRRKRWPSSKQRYCTSDFKRAPIDKVITGFGKGSWYRLKILNVMGMRAAESPARAKKHPFERDWRRTNTKRSVDTWLPIFRLSTPQVWDLITQHGLEMHPAYAAGMPRLSCCFCIFSPRSALLRAGQLNPGLLDQYVAVEEEIGHTFRDKFRIADVRADLLRGEAPGEITDWRM